VGMGAPLSIFSPIQAVMSIPGRALKAIANASLPSPPIPSPPYAFEPTKSGTYVEKGVELPAAGARRAKNAVAPCPTGYVRNGAGQCVPNQFGGSGGTARARPGTEGVGALPPVVVSAPVGMGAISLFSAKPDPIGNVFSALAKGFSNVAAKGTLSVKPPSIPGANTAVPSMMPVGQVGSTEYWYAASTGGVWTQTASGGWKQVATTLKNIYVQATPPAGYYDPTTRLGPPPNITNYYYTGYLFTGPITQGKPVGPPPGQNFYFYPPRLAWISIPKSALVTI